MPGEITHYKIFKDSRKFACKAKHSKVLVRSLESLFASEENYRAALFGSLGPNIFDYVPSKDGEVPFGHPVSFHIHNGRAGLFLKSMINKLLGYDDQFNEWASIQRAYVYGMTSHLVADAVYHPFIFFWSGIPGKDPGRVKHFRRQNLHFAYNIDLHYLYFDQEDSLKQFVFEEMLPCRRTGKKESLEPAVRSIIIEGLQGCSSELVSYPVWFKRKEDDIHSGIGPLDFILPLSKRIHNMKRGKAGRLQGLYNYFSRRQGFKWDVFVPYQDRRRYNSHVLNFHRDRWENPSGCSGAHYESIDGLLKLATEMTVELWVLMENVLIHGADSSELFNHRFFKLNSYTGCECHTYDDMQLQEPFTLRI